MQIWKINLVSILRSLYIPFLLPSSLFTLVSHTFNNFSQIPTMHHILPSSRSSTLSKSNTVPALTKFITKWGI